ncbi:hypothetical protein O974_26990 [Mycobacterium avium 11-0986]|nr:hypothetical protein O974_26990 [Mycobacterium avium 11-0986]
MIIVADARLFARVDGGGEIIRWGLQGLGHIAAVFTGAAAIGDLLGVLDAGEPGITRFVVLLVGWGHVVVAGGR